MRPSVLLKSDGVCLFDHWICMLRRAQLGCFGHTPQSSSQQLVNCERCCC